MKSVIITVLLAISALAQAPKPGTIVGNSGGGGGGGTGTVTSVVIAGTTNQITATGTCVGTVTITCTLSLPSGLILPGTINGLTITTTTGTITIAAAKVLTVSSSLNFLGTDGVTLTFPTTNATIARTDAGQTFTGNQTMTALLQVGSTAPTQTQADNSTKVATTAYVDTGLAAKGATGAAGGDLSGTYPNPKVVGGVFNVRAKYGAVPDGATDNSTAITNAFTASNAFTVGTPTVYFDCDTSTTICEYNYGGSGTSPINPTIATTIQCAPGATLNYTGTAHAADIGATGLTTAYPNRFTIQGCRWTGGSSMTAGIFVNTFNIEPLVQNNEFYNFGNRTGYSISLSGNVWSPTIRANVWTDTDGASRNMLDAHTAVNADLIFTDNRTECFTSIGGACSNSSTGVGLWIFDGTIINNALSFHAPEIRISTCQACGGGGFIHARGNQFEGATSGWPAPQISYGDPGATGISTPQGTVVVEDNYFTGISYASGISVIGPESASSGNFNLQNATITNNIMDTAPGTGAVWINTNGGARTYTSNNRTSGGTVLSQFSSPTILDATAALNANFGIYSNVSGSAINSLASAIPVFDSSGLFIKSPATSSTVIGLFSGCSGTQYLSADGTCHSVPASSGTVFSTTNSAEAASIGTVTMVTPGVDTNYTFTVYAIQTVATVGCGTAPSLKVQLGVTDAFTNTSIFPAALLSLGNFGPPAVTQNFSSSIGQANNMFQGQFSFRAKAGTSVSYSTTYSAGSGCSTGASYSIAPNLTQQ